MQIQICRGGGAYKAATRVGYTVREKISIDLLLVDTILTKDEQLVLHSIKYPEKLEKIFKENPGITEETFFSLINKGHNSPELSSHYDAYKNYKAKEEIKIFEAMRKEQELKKEEKERLQKEKADSLATEKREKSERLFVVDIRKAPAEYGVEQATITVKEAGQPPLSLKASIDNGNYFLLPSSEKILKEKNILIDEFRLSIKDLPSEQVDIEIKQLSLTERNLHPNEPGIVLVKSGVPYSEEVIISSSPELREETVEAPTTEVCNTETEIHSIPSSSEMKDDNVSSGIIGTLTNLFKK